MSEVALIVFGTHSVVYADCDVGESVWEYAALQAKVHGKSWRMEMMTNPRMASW